MTRREARNGLKARDRIPHPGPEEQFRQPRPAPVSDLHPDRIVPRTGGDRDFLPRERPSRYAARCSRKPAHQQKDRIPGIG